MRKVSVPMRMTSGSERRNSVTTDSAKAKPAAPSTSSTIVVTLTLKENARCIRSYFLAP